jgi:hypothetical protein
MKHRNDIPKFPRGVTIGKPNSSDSVGDETADHLPIKANLPAPLVAKAETLSAENRPLVAKIETLKTEAKPLYAQPQILAASRGRSTFASCPLRGNG